MTTLSPLSLLITGSSSHNYPLKVARYHLFLRPPPPIKFCCLNLKSNETGQNWSKIKLWAHSDKVSLLGLRKSKDGILRRERVVVVRFNQGFGFNGGDGDGSGRKIDGNTARVLGNLALAVGLTYLSMTGQLGWVLDTIVSLWLLALIVPVIGIGAFLWWAGRDMIQGTCPNCGNEFQVFKSSLNDELQLCPFCTQPFSVEGDEFVKEPIKFSSKRSTAFGQFDDFVPWSRKDENTSTTIVDVEAEVKDLD